MEEEHQQKNKVTQNVKAIIVGQGIAGSILAFQYIKAGFNVLVVSDDRLSKSSKVAAGIWNPVVFKRLTKSWLADELISQLYLFYQWVEKTTNTRFVNEMPIIKAFNEEQEKTFWQKKAQEENLFLDSHIYTSFKIDEKSTIDSYSKVKQSGYIDLSVFLGEVKTYLAKHSQLLEETFDYNALVHANESINYKGISADHIIFCEGHKVSENPFFNYITLKPAKGEVLTVKCHELLWENAIINKGFFILPLGNNLYKVGATYEWQELNELPTAERKTELLKKLDSLITSPYEIIKHEAGIRPSSLDRRPILGQHPQFKNYYIFNGLGTKGVMLAPYFSQQLLNHLENNGSLSVEVDVKRFEQSFISK